MKVTKVKTTDARSGMTGKIVVVACAVAGAVLFGVYGQEWLGRLYKSIVDIFHFNQIENPYEKRGIFIGGPLALFGGIAGGFLGGMIIRTIDRILVAWDSMEKGDKLTLFLGVFLGMIVSVPFLQLFQALDMPGMFRVVLIIGVMVGSAAIAVYGLQAMSDILPWNRTRTKSRRSGIKLLDTNVIIDGRIHDVMRTGFLEGQLYVPQFVLEELQFIADSHDSLKRQRGRRGLEVLRHMQADYNMQVGTLDKYAPDPQEEVDARLVRLAKAVGADIVTNDFNLNRVAALQDVKVLSLNDLALSLRTNILPEESLTLKIIREGNQVGQGIGYLEDGTMVVIENGQPHIGETAEVMVTQVIQTERGKMIFADYDAEGATEPKFEPRKRSGSRRNH